MSLWTPASITTSLWLDAADSSTLFDATSGGSLVAPNSQVLRWEDKSGAGWHLTDTSGPVRLQSSLGGLDGLDFSSNRFLRNSSYSAEVSQTKLIRVLVARRLVDGNNISVSSAAADTMLQGISGLGWTSYQRSGIYVAGGTKDLNPHVFVAIIDGTQPATHADRIKLFVDGSLNPVTTTSGTIQGTTATGNGVDAGRLFGVNGAFWNGMIYEHAAIAGEADLGLVQKLEGYAAWKWGLQGNLPNDHPHKNAAPTDGVTPLRRRQFLGYGL